MTRLERCIEMVKKGHVSKNRPWIFKEDGQLRDDIIAFDTVKLLELFKPYEINVDDEYIENIHKEAWEKDNVWYTYNNSTMLTNDIQFEWIHTKDNCLIIKAWVHCGNDARSKWDNDFVFKTDKWYDAKDDEFTTLYYFICELIDDADYGNIDITDKLHVNFSIFGNSYVVYDNETGEDLGSYNEIDIDELKNILREDGVLKEVC